MWTALLFVCWHKYGLEFQTLSWVKITPKNGKKFVQSFVVYREGSNKYPLLIQYVCKNTSKSFGVMQGGQLFGRREYHLRSNIAMPEYREYF
jgi:hypothetical protein